MNRNKYLGHESQISGVEEHRLTGGRGDGMRLLEVRNGRGMELTVTPDRCADISRLTFMGRNMGYFSPCGYVGPSYYDKDGENFLQSFTAGFLSTCGLTTVGGPAEDGDEYLPMHGTIGNIPAEQIQWFQTENTIEIRAAVRDARVFGRKLILSRRLLISTDSNTFTIRDTVENYGDQPSPLMLLYHMNMGYPLLSEKAELIIPSDRVVPRDDHAAEGLETRLQLLPPQAGFQEQCYFHEFTGEGRAMIYNPEIGLGLKITFDPTRLKRLCQWKMLGEHDYVLGLEPANCTPAGRAAMREQGLLEWLLPGEARDFSVTVTLAAGREEWTALKGGKETC